MNLLKQFIPTLLEATIICQEALQLMLLDTWRNTSQCQQWSQMANRLIQVKVLYLC